MDDLERSIARISAFVGSAVLLAMMLQIAFDVFTRNFLGAGFPATPEIVSRYYMVAVSFLPLAMTEVADRHIEATILTGKLRGALRQALLTAGVLIAIVVFGLLTWGTASEAMKQTARRAYVETGLVQFPTWPSYWIVPVSAALMLIVLTIRLIRLQTGRFREVEHDPLEEVSNDNGEIE